jgi:hypothetical protein
VLKRTNNSDSSEELASKGDGSNHGSRSLIKHVNLSGVRGLIHLSGQLLEMSKMIGTLMENDLASLLINDIQQFVNKSQDAQTPSHQWAQKILMSESSSLAEITKGSIFEEADFKALADLKSRMVPLIMGLVRIDRVGVALQMYREKLVKLVKQVTKQVCPYPT